LESISKVTKFERLIYRPQHFRGVALPKENPCMLTQSNQQYYEQVFR
jgi:hypothetical protein